MYEQHMQRAARYAALALTERHPQPVEIAELAVLRSDLLVALDESMRLLTGITPRPDRATSLGGLAAHPVQALVDQLSVVSRTGLVEWDDRPAPTQRWSSLPSAPSHADGPVQTWTGLAVEAVLARYALEPATRRLSDDTRWRCVADVATLTEAAAVLDSSLTDVWVSGSAARRTWRESAATLEAAAREVRAWAGNPDAPAVPTPASRAIVIVNDLERLPLATQRLTQHLRADTSGPGLGLSSVLASITALAHVSHAAADALDAARRDQAVGLPDLLAQASCALRAHAAELAETLRSHRTRLGSTSTGSPATLAQSRELASSALPRLRDLPARPARALAASPALLAYGSVVAQATAAARAAVAELNDRGLLMVRAESEDAVYRGWYETRHVGGHERLLEALDHAVAAARDCPPDPSRTAAAASPARESPAALLGQELARQREQRRPAHPCLPVTPTPTLSR
jgi:hypothetical protein